MDFDLTGFYIWREAQGGKGDITGRITVVDDEFEGMIHDHGSRAPDQNIRGWFEQGRMVFVKFPPAVDLANLVYGLHKEGEGIEGTYMGRWGALPYKLEVHDKLLLMNVHLSVCSIGDAAEITLSRITSD